MLHGRLPRAARLPCRAASPTTCRAAGEARAVAGHRRRVTAAPRPTASLGWRGASTTRSGARLSPPRSRLGLRRRGAGRLPRRARGRGPARGLAGPAGAARAAGVRDPDAAAVGARDARLPDAARPAARRRRADRAELGARSRANATNGRVDSGQRDAAGRDADLPRALDRARRPAAWRAAGSSSTRTGRRARPRSGCRCTASRRRTRRASAPTTSASSRSPAPGSRSTGPAPGRRRGRASSRTCSSRARRSRARARGSEKSGDGVSLASGHRAAELIMEEEPMTDVPASTAMRESLDHCVKCTICETACPFSNVTPLFPGPKYVGPQAERFRTDEPRRPTPRSTTARAAASAPRSARRASTSPRSTRRRRRALRERDGVALREQHDRPPDRRRPARHARRADRELDAAQPLFRLLIEKTLGIHRRRGDADVRGPDVPGLGQAPPAAGVAEAGRLLPRLRRRTTTSRDVGEMAVAVLAHNGFAVDVPKQDCCGLPLQSNGLFDAARGYTRRLAKNLAPRRATGDAVIVGTSTSCTLMLKREANEILGLDGEPDLELRERADLRHRRVPARAPRPRRARAPTSSPST